MALATQGEPALERFLRRADRHPVAVGVAITLLCVLAAEALRPWGVHSLALVNLGIVLAALLGGYRAGFAGAVILSVYAFFALAMPGLGGRAVVATTTAWATAATVGALKRRADRLAENRVQQHQERVESLAAANARLDKANRGLDDFARTVAHDLKGPLAAAQMQVALARDDLAHGDAANAQAGLADAEQMMRDMGLLVDNLLAFSREAEPRRQIVDVAQLARSLEPGLRLRYHGHPVVFATPPKALVEADPELLRIVLSNLLDNAWKYTQGTPQPEVHVTMEDGAVTVRDNGRGFDSTEAQRVFEPFARLHHDVPGTGLGLATAHSIVARHGGRIWAEASPGTGAVLRFTMGPRVRASTPWRTRGDLSR